ncbi:MAG: hemerythrin domain-containing protein [Syntrophomonadaceae bacterium]|jgi:hemerythrin-like domain-containing protein|nr:hemerythrin domain-containing protein [Bacillota bacterium]NLP22988.1 hemerythrin [Syntrophomonadaceae bacterium]
MQATQQLREEHSAVLLMLQVLERLIDRLQEGDRTAEEDLAPIIDFLKGFVDRCHHGKEEEWLFPALEAVGIPRQNGPIGVMLEEHEAGRSLIQEMVQTLDQLEAGEMKTQLRQAALNYIHLLRSHIRKENEVLFNMADQRLTPEEQAHLYEEFEQLELERMGVGQHEEYHELLHRLMQKYGVQP